MLFKHLPGFNNSEAFNSFFLSLFNWRRLYLLLIHDCFPVEIAIFERFNYFGPAVRPRYVESVYPVCLEI